MKKISGGKKWKGGRLFGNGKGSKRFKVELKDKSKEQVLIGWMSSWLRPKVEAWWRSNVVKWERI